MLAKLARAHFAFLLGKKTLSLRSRVARIAGHSRANVRRRFADVFMHAAGFGTHEICLYYDLIRLLLTESYQQVRAGRLTSVENEIERLEQIKHAWLEAPDPESHGKSPALMIEWERKRIPLVLTPKESIIDEDCPICQAVAADLETPMFWHLDGCNMDDQFEFSFFKTRAEWELERQRMEELDREYRRQKAGEKQGEFEPITASFEPC